MAENTDLIGQLARSGKMRIAGALAVTALVGGGLGVIMLRGDSSGKALLYSGLDLEEAAEIAGKLDQARIKYDMRADGSAIFVERAQVLDARMMLSEQGLPTRGSVGYELFDKTDALGQTTFIQNINKLRALEGELSRTIGSLDRVKAARVHLVLPERRLFEQKGQAPSASVVLSVVGELSEGQVRAVRNLVASAVPEMDLRRITVLDDKGRLLAAGAENDEAGFGGANSDERKESAEERIRDMVLQIVESVAGPGAAQVQVSADIDFNRVTQSNETYDPDGRVVRSQTTVEDSSSDQTRDPADAATVANNVPGGAPAPEEAPTSQATTRRAEETVNYEISKTTRTEIVEGGRMKRLSVAVAIDDVRTLGAEGEPPTYAPRPQEEIDRITALVKSAVGFDEKRGDIVEVVNVSFARPDVSIEGGDKPGPFDFDKGDIIQGVEIGALLLTALALVFFVLRPLAKGLSKPEQDELAEALAISGQGGGPGGAHAQLMLPESGGGGSQGMSGQSGDSGIDVARITGQVKASSIKRISEVVENHPDESVAIIRAWLAEEREAAQA